MIDQNITHRSVSGNTAECPSCEEVVRLNSRPRIMQLFTCPSCRTELRVVGVSPIELDWVDEDETVAIPPKKQDRQNTKALKNQRRHKETLEVWDGDNDWSAKDRKKAKGRFRDG